MAKQIQSALFDAGEPAGKKQRSSTFTGNMSLPVHRWYRYSAGFAAEWVESVIEQFNRDRPARVFDPFAGSGTTLLAAASRLSPFLPLWQQADRPPTWRLWAPRQLDEHRKQDQNHGSAR